jgi:hypothetical protein
MKLIRKVAVLMLLLVAFLATSQTPSRADYECEQIAAQNRDACVANCDNYPVWNSCPAHCESNYQIELLNCGSQ